MDRAVGLMALALVAGCLDEPPPVPLPEWDRAVFAAAVQPVLDTRCADPTCHGRADRPLAVYSAGRYRRDPARTWIEEPLEDEELDANARALAAFALESSVVDDCLVLRKPLALSAGGCGHVGGEIFAARDERDYRALRDWLAALEWSVGAEP